MNIRKRLRLSNLLMVIVPVAVSCVIALVVAVAAWHALGSGLGLGVDDSEDFFQASAAVEAAVEPVLTDGGPDSLRESSYITNLLDTSGMSLVVSDGSEVVYQYGTFDDSDLELVSAASQTSGDVQLSRGSRCLAAWDVTSGSATYRVSLLGTTSDVAARSTKFVVAVAALAILIALVVAVVLTGGFLSKFVLRHITDPLDQLAEGTRKIRDGNLDYRLPEGRDDEFAPVFEDFNQMAVRLQDSVEQQRRLERRRSELVTGLSHDLRSPLTSIQAYSEGLLDGVAKTPERRRDYAEKILGKSHEMGELISQMSDVARVGRTVEDTSLTTMDLAAFVGGWVETNRAAYELRGASVACDAAPASARADEGLLARMLSNLLDNCLRYAVGEDGTCSIRVSCGSAPEGLGAWVAVDDDGPGVESGTESRLFDLFYRGDAARSKTAEGHGIGLAVVSLGMERMGGTVEASRSDLGGLRVTMRFPALTGGGEAQTNGGDGA